MAKASEFLHMGGYGAYIWPCYALAVGIFIALTIWARQKLHLAQQSLKQLQDSHDT